jgi:hypothetical protein
MWSDDTTLAFLSDDCAVGRGNKALEYRCGYDVNGSSERQKRTSFCAVWVPPESCRRRDHVVSKTLQTLHHFSAIRSWNRDWEPCDPSFH